MHSPKRRRKGGKQQKTAPRGFEDVKADKIAEKTVGTKWCPPGCAII